MQYLNLPFSIKVMHRLKDLSQNATQVHFAYDLKN